jgi:hypothetical protein
VHDGQGPVHRGVDAFAGGQVPGDELDAVGDLLAAPAEHPHVATGVEQPRDDEPPERAGATGDQNGFRVPLHDGSPQTVA